MQQTTRTIITETNRHARSLTDAAVHAPSATHTELPYPPVADEVAIPNERRRLEPGCPALHLIMILELGCI